LVNSGPFNIESTVLHDELHKLAIETTQSRKKVAESQVKRPSNRTVGRICKSLNIKSGNAELTTNARAIACADVRNAVSMCAAQHLMVPLVDHYLILNMDATQYTVGGSSKGKKKVQFINRPTKGKALKAKKDSSDSGITSYFIKHYLLMSAGGVSSDPVYVIADDNMTKDDIDVHEVSGLGHSIALGNKGYVIFAKTRCANVKFYEWFNKTILTQFIAEIKAFRNLPIHALTWFQLDGEAIQIECYQSPEMIQLLNENFVVVGKPAASTTEISQPCDIGDCSKATKCKVKNISNDDVAMETHMLERLNKVYNDHKMQYATSSKKKIP